MKTSLIFERAKSRPIHLKFGGSLKGNLRVCASLDSEPFLGSVPGGLQNSKIKLDP